MAEEVVFPIRVDADAEPAAEAAAELEKFRSAIGKSQSALAEYRKSMSLLKGSSDEVVAAKKALKGAIELEKGKISQANLGILKLGGSYERLAKAAKKNLTATDASRKAFAGVSGHAKGLLERFDGLSDLMPALASGWGLLAAGVALGVASFALATAAVASLTVKFTEWLATTADANRNLQVTREAFSGNAKNATAWGHAMDWASEKTALTTQELQGLVVQTEKTYRGARISGQGMVDAFKASAAAAGAGRQDVASFFDEIIARGKQSGRSFVSFEDFAKFRNAGIPVKELYKELGINAAQAARGAVVSTDRMAAALRKVSENRFAEINGKKMLSLGAQWDRFKDNLMRFTNDLAGEGGALEPLLSAIQQVASAFDLSTQSGQDLKKVITEYGKVLSDAIVAHLPDIKAFVQSAIELTGAFISGAVSVVKWAQSSAALKGAIGPIIESVKAIGFVFLAVGAVVGAVVAIIGMTIAGVAQLFYGLYKAVVAIWKAIAGVDWGGLGTAIVEGIKNGLTAAWDGLKGAVTSMGEGIKDTFKGILGIHSPSRVFADYGFQTSAGYSQGIAQGTPKVETATTAMASSAQAGAQVNGATGGTAGGSRTSVGTIENHFHISGGNAEEVKKALSGSVLEQFETSIKFLLQSSGVPTGAPASSGG